MEAEDYRERRAFLLNSLREVRARKRGARHLPNLTTADLAALEHRLGCRLVKLQEFLARLRAR